MKKRYQEDEIVVLGYSIGTAAAAQLGSTNFPSKLLLQAPYYSLEDLMGEYYPAVSTRVLKYKFETYRYLCQTQAPVLIFHGDIDEVINYKSSVKLKECFKSGDRLILLKGVNHNGITYNPEYLQVLKESL